MILFWTQDSQVNTLLIFLNTKNHISVIHTIESLSGVLLTPLSLTHPLPPGSGVIDTGCFI